MKRASLAQRPWVRGVVVVMVAAAAGLVVWLAVRGHGSSTSATGTTVATAAGLTPTGTTQVSATGLRRLAASFESPVYWAGPRRGVAYEFTATPDGRTYVRYLPRGVRAGTSKAYLTIGTYPVANALAKMRTAARARGTVSLRPGAGAFAFFAKARPTNVYLAYPGANYQIEVYAPSARTAQRLVATRRIRALPSTTAALAAPGTTAVASRPAALARLSARLGRPIYWLGRIRGSTYELTRTPDSRVYIRYLPAGVPVGSSKPYLTVATYPLAHALAATRVEARKAGSVEIALPGGAVAFFSGARPTNVYVAFPGVNEQVELFDPSAGEARRLVAAGRVRAVP